MALIRVIELGPFGCQIERVLTENLDVPSGYRVKKISDDKLTINIEPTVQS